MGNNKSKMGEGASEGAVQKPQQANVRPPGPQIEGESRKTEYDWVLEYIDNFIRSPECKLKVEMFIDENCLHFPVQPIEYHTDIRCLGIHEEFSSLIKDLLGEHLEKLGVTMEQFENALWNGGRNNHNTKIVQYFDAVNDFQTFTQQMVAKHHQLESEAQNLMPRFDEKAQLQWALEESKRLAEQQQQAEVHENQLVEQLKQASLQTQEVPPTVKTERLLSTEAISVPRSPPPTFVATPPQVPVEQKNDDALPSAPPFPKDEKPSLPPILPNHVSSPKTKLAPLKTLPALATFNKKAFNPNLNDLNDLPQLSQFELEKAEQLANSRRTGGKGLPPLTKPSALSRVSVPNPDSKSKPSDELIRRKKFLLAQKQKILQQRRQELEKEVSGTK